MRDFQRIGFVEGSGARPGPPQLGLMLFEERHQSALARAHVSRPDSAGGVPAQRTREDAPHESTDVGLVARSSANRVQADSITTKSVKRAWAGHSSSRNELLFQLSNCRDA